MIEFDNSWAFLLLFLPLLARWIAPAHKRSTDALQVPYFNKMVELTGTKPSLKASIVTRTKLQAVVLCLGWLFLVIAAMKPIRVGEPIVIPKSARDLMVIVDLSSSMQARDFTNLSGVLLDRLEAVKLVLNEFSRNRQGDRLGLIVFGDAPYLQTPFTSDIEVWQALLDETEVSMAGGSTVIGDAVGLSIDVFQQSDTQNKVIILLTDGNDTGSKVPPLEAALIAKARNIKLYTIAMGNPKTVGIEALDLDTLKKMAAITGGKSYLAESSQELSNAYAQIDSYEPELFQSVSYRPRQSVYYYPLGLWAIICLIALLWCAIPTLVHGAENEHL
ncbi:VWA domain-containing protein [Vibrio kyushuensis]|uniref:VWA domain-containing protein n=1 Tax=Vibrio kyushuensis TaxID=2910249 RepID=UPI003D13CDAD